MRVLPVMVAIGIDHNGIIAGKSEESALVFGLHLSCN